MTFCRRAVAAAALLVGAAVAPLSLSAPAHAAACSGADGISVVVDFAELGGGVTAGCADVPDGTRANAALKAAGYSLTMATKSPDFLCRVNGLPASDPCVNSAPADAYWSVWWADGDGGSWVYSARGIGSLRVPDGGYLALAWHQGSGRSEPPATVPVARGDEPTATPAPPRTTTPGKPKATRSSKPGRDTATSNPSTSQQDPGPAAPSGTVVPTPGATGPVAPTETPTAVPTPSLSTPTPGETVESDPGLVPADEITAGPETAGAETSDTEGGLPVWVPALVVLVVVGFGAGAVIARRRGA